MVKCKFSEIIGSGKGKWLLGGSLATLLVGSLATLFTAWSHAAPESPDSDWRTYEANDAADHYSPLSQINRENVSQLKEVWRYELSTGSAQANPLIVRNIMYIVGDAGRIVALDAETGALIWQSAATTSERARGLVYWESKDVSDRRILYIDGDNLMAIDASTGKQITEFGINGAVDLREGLGRPVETIPRIASATPGRVFENLVILGSAPGEEYGAAPGHIRAYDVRTGKMEWIFHTIPQPGEYGYSEWTPESAKNGGGANMWGGLSIDTKRGIAYIPLGSAKYNFWGGDRPGSNLFANSLVALDARTGKRLWHFQTVHHDLWDYDLTTTPTLMTVKHDGKNVDIVVQAGKTGFLYVFNRVTGQPLWPIVERPVPQSDVPGEVSSPTQPFPTVVPPFVKQTFTADDLDPRMDRAEYDAFRSRVLAARNEGLFTPPTTGREAVQMPGNGGGSNWGLSGAEPNSGRYYVIGYNAPALLRVEKTGIGGITGAGLPPIQAGEQVYKDHCQMCHGTELQGAGNVTSLKGLSARATPAAVRTVIAQGRGNMPAFQAVLNPIDIDNVTAFLTGSLPTVASAPSEAPLNDVELRYRSPYGFLFRDTSMLSARKPPWSVLSAYDLNRGKLLWQTPVGTAPNYDPDLLTGVDRHKGGIVVTGGGLIFSAGGDRRIYAFDRDTGKVLWRGDLPAFSIGIASTYSVNGRQYLVVPAASSGSIGAMTDKNAGRNAYVVYALPR